MISDVTILVKLTNGASLSFAIIPSTVTFVPGRKNNQKNPVVDGFRKDRSRNGCQVHLKGAEFEFNFHFLSFLIEGNASYQELFTE